MEDFPLAIYFLLDGSKALFVDEKVTNSNIRVGYYRYVRPKEKCGLDYPFDLSQIYNLYINAIIDIK